MASRAPASPARSTATAPSSAPTSLRATASSRGALASSASPARSTATAPSTAPTPPRAAKRAHAGAAALITPLRPTDAAPVSKVWAIASDDSTEVTRAPDAEEVIGAPEPQAAYAKTVLYNADAAPTRGEAAVLAAIAAAYVVPRSFDQDKQRFGPLAGLSRAARLARAYTAGALALQPGAAALPMVCVECAETGHAPRDCRAAFAKRARA